jgi:NAD(P)H-flavin reductase
MASEPMLPVAYRVAWRQAETRDCVTLRLEPAGAALPPFLPGQFTMLCRPGVGEIAISVSGDPSAGDGALTQTIRDVGAVSRSLCRAEPGALVGVRGPFGTSWGLDTAVGRDLVIVAGGVGLAPLRPVLLGALADREAYRRVVLLAGARGPADFLFRDQLADWAARTDLEVEVTIDQPAVGWAGAVGFVTEPLAPPLGGTAADRGVPVRAGADDAPVCPGAAGQGDGCARYPGLARAEHEVRCRPVRPLPARPTAAVPRRAGR